jgi:hypothetical protein
MKFYDKFDICYKILQLIDKTNRPYIHFFALELFTTVDNRCEIPRFCKTSTKKSSDSKHLLLTCFKKLL